MLTTARRIITGHDADGRSIILDDGPSDRVLVDEATGEGAAEIWMSPCVPETCDPPEMRPCAPMVLAPPKGGIRSRLFSVAPGKVEPAGFPAAREAVRAVYAGIGGADALVESDRHPAMHRTGTVDLVVVIQGALTLILDKDEAVLRPGDTVVQRGTAHAWANYGDELAVAFVALIDADDGA